MISCRFVRLIGIWFMAEALACILIHAFVLGAPWYGLAALLKWIDDTVDGCIEKDEDNNG